MEGKCKERIDDGLCEICISAEYPFSLEGFLHPNMNDVEKMLLIKGVEAHVSWISAEGIRTSGWARLKTEELANIVRSGYTSIVSEDILGKAVVRLAENLNAAAEKALQVPGIEALAATMRNAMGLLEVEFRKREAKGEWGAN